MNIPARWIVPIANYFDDDERMNLWLAANGVSHIEHPHPDGSGERRIRYWRADGSEVDMKTAYGYDEITPYTSVAGHA